jgi:hypothetical protein
LNRNITRLLLIILVISSALLAKDIVVKAVLERTVSGLSGLKVSFGHIDVGLFNTSIRVRNMAIYNPPSFSENVMAEINELYVNYDITSGFRNEIHIRDMVFDVRAVNVVRNTRGENNLNSLKIVAALESIDKKKADIRVPKIFIDKLRLKGGRVTYTDYTKAPYPSVTEFMIPIDEKYENISNPYELVSLIVSRSLVKTTPSAIIGFDMTPLQNEFQGAVRNGVEAIKKGLGLP